MSEPSRTRATALVDALARHGERVALVDGDVLVPYDELADRVERLRERLGAARRLVAVEAGRDVASLVAYLGALAAECPVLLLPPGGGDAALSHAYDPDVVLRADGVRVAVQERRAVSAHVLHPALALLMSTSGSSGSPKLVRLSRRNLLANAAAIGEALHVRDDDRAITTLPLHYCYGLSVVHSHLLRGAAVVLTEMSVLDAGFWDLFRRSRVTTLPAVPYTFELLERAHFAEEHLPTLRCVTQAGGRLAPDKVRAYAELGAQRGWELFVMYGQTEATARMAVLPAQLARSRPTSIGRAVPGGAFALAPVEGQPDGVGELVYSGDNVMLGYATEPADLALGRTVDRLHTGDLARLGADGLYEVVGRRTRFVKLFGLRLDQGHLEEHLRARGTQAVVEPVGDDRLGVAVEGPADAAAVLDEVAGTAGLPRHAVVVQVVTTLPRTASGKPDTAAVRSLLAEPVRTPALRQDSVRALYEEVLGVTVRGQDTFAGLGGDSLSYVEMSVRLEDLLGRLPDDWPTRTVDGLAAPDARVATRRRPTVDTSVALRAAAIVLVVGSHADLLDVRGGAHLLLLLAGYNLARFQLAIDRPGRARALLRSARRLILPAVTWIAAVTVLTDEYGWSYLLPLSAVLAPDTWDPRWRFWFVEALGTLLAGVAALLAVRPVDRWQRRHPFVAPLVLVGLGLLMRWTLAGPTGAGQRFTAPAVLWLFALGWAAAAARTPAQRLLVAGLGVVGMLGWLGSTPRELVVVGGLAVLLLAARLPSSRLLGRLAGVLASSSLYVYVTQWQVHPVWDETAPALAFVASFAVGIAYWQLWSFVSRALRSRCARWCRPDDAGDSRRPVLVRARRSRPAAEAAPAPSGSA